MYRKKIIVMSRSTDKWRLEEFFDHSIRTLDYSNTWFKVNNGDVTDKLQLLFSQLRMRNGIFVNTIFPLLSKLKKHNNPLYLKLVTRVSGFLRLYRKDLWILLYKPSSSEREIMKSMNLRYAEFNTEQELINYIKKILCHH